MPVKRKSHRKMRGGEPNSHGSTFGNPRYFDANAPLPESDRVPSNIVAKSFPDTDLKPFPDSSGMATGGKKKRSHKKSPKKSPRKSPKKSPRKSPRKSSKKMGILNKLKKLF